MGKLVLPRGYDPNPPSVSSHRGITLPVSVFDKARLMDSLRRGLIDGLPPMDDPTDDLLIATVVDNGMPLWSADQMRHNPALRLQYYLFWMDVRDAAKGDAEAKGRVDGAREAWAQMRKDELISDIPNHTIGLWER